MNREFLLAAVLFKKILAQMMPLPSGIFKSVFWRILRNCGFFSQAKSISGFGVARKNCRAENLPKLPSVKLAIGVGGTFDFIAGVVPRAPYLMRKTGLEWLYRLYHQPRRIKRIINAALIFPLKVISARTKDLR